MTVFSSTKIMAVSHKDTYAYAQTSVIEVIVNTKGGVGKTVYSKNHAYLLSKEVPTLFVDMDPRQNAKNLFYSSDGKYASLPYPWGTFTDKTLPEKIVGNKELLGKLFVKYSQSRYALRRSLQETTRLIEGIKTGLTTKDKDALIQVLRNTLDTSQLFSECIRPTGICNDLTVQDLQCMDNLEYSKLYTLPGLHKYHDTLTLAQTVDMMHSIKNIPGYKAKIIDVPGGTSSGIITFIAGAIKSGATIKLVSEPNPDSTEAILGLLGYLAITLGIEAINQASVILIFNKYKLDTPLKTDEQKRKKMLMNLARYMPSTLQKIKKDNIDMLSEEQKKNLNNLLEKPIAFDFSNYELQIIAADPQGIEKTEWRNHVYSRFITDSTMYSDLVASTDKTLEQVRRVHHDLIKDDIWYLAFEEMKSHDQEFLVWRKKLNGKNMNRKTIESLEARSIKQNGVGGLLDLWDETHSH